MSSVQIDRIDGVSSSTAVKGPCAAASSVDITLSGEQTVSGVAVVAGDRVLVKAQSTGSENGIYVVDTGPWRRAADFSNNRDVRKGTQVPVNGATTGVAMYAVTSDDPIVIGTTDLTFALANPSSLAPTIFTAATDAFSDLQSALNGGVSGQSLMLALKPGLTESDNVTLNDSYQTSLIGAGMADTGISTSNTDGTQSILINDLNSDRFYPTLQGFRLYGGATKGHGIESNFVGGNIGPHINEVRVQGFSGSGKAGINLTNSFIGTLEHDLIFSNDIGIDFINSKGITSFGTWLADNITWQLRLDEGSSGNWLHFNEVGLAALDATKGAAYINGNRSYSWGGFTENFQKPRAWWFGDHSYSWVAEFGTHSALSIYDEGWFNQFPIVGSSWLQNLTAANGFAGAYAGHGNMTNLMPYSSYGQGIGTRVTVSGTNAPTATVDSTFGYLDSNSLKIVWSTSYAGGDRVSMSTTFSATQYECITFSGMIYVSRDLTSSEHLQIVVRGAGGAGRYTHHVADLRTAEGWQPFALIYVATATETVNLSLELVSGSTRSAITTWIDDWHITKDKKSYTLVENKTSTSRSLSNKGPYLPRATFGRAHIDVRGTKAAVPATLHSAIGDVATTAVTTEEVLGTFTLPAYALERPGQRLRLRAWGVTGANSNSKTCRIKAGTTTIATTDTNTANNKAWELEAEVAVLTTTTQRAIGKGIINATIGSQNVTKLTADLTGSVVFTATGQNSSASAGDIELHGFVIDLLDAPGQ